MLIDMKKSCNAQNNAVTHHLKTEKDELIRKMANHIECIWNILLQFGDKLNKAELLTEKEKSIVRREYEDGYLPLKITQNKGGKDNQLFLMRLLPSLFEEPGTNNCSSSYLNTHLKGRDISSSDCSSSLYSSMYHEETSRSNINPSTSQNKHVNNPEVKRSKARKSFTRSHKPHHLLQDKNQQSMIHIPHNPLNSKNENINSYSDDNKYLFQASFKQALCEQDTPNLMSTKKSNEVQKIFLDESIKNLERNLVESPAINLKKVSRECGELKDKISDSDTHYPVSFQLSNGKIINLDSLESKKFLDNMNNPVVKQAKARKKFSNSRNSQSFEEKSHLTSNLSIGMPNFENNTEISDKQKSSINSPFKQISCIETEDSLKEKDFLFPDSIGGLLPELSKQILYKETNSYSTDIPSIAKKVTDIGEIASFPEKVTDSWMSTSINGTEKPCSSAENTQLKFSQKEHEFQDAVSFGHNPNSQEDNDSMKQKVLLNYKSPLKKQTVNGSSDSDHNLFESNEVVKRQCILLTQKKSYRTQLKQSYSVGSNYQLENDLALSDEDDTLDCDLERNSSKDETSPRKNFDSLCLAPPEIIRSSHNYEENAFSMSNKTFPENRNVNSALVDSSNNAAIDINCSNINRLHTEFLNSPIVKKTEARKDSSRKQDPDHSVNNKIQQNGLSNSSVERLNSKKGIISSLHACNSDKDGPFLMKNPRHLSELDRDEETKIAEKASQALCNIDGNTIDLNSSLCRSILSDSAVLNRDLLLLSVNMSKSSDFVEQNSLVVSSSKNSPNEGNNDLPELDGKESSRVSLIEKESCNAEYGKMRSFSNQNADQCGLDFLEEKTDDIEQSENQRINLVECGKDAWKSLDDMSTVTSEKMKTLQICSKNLLSVHTNSVVENRSNPVTSSKSENLSSVDRSPENPSSVDQLPVNSSVDQSPKKSSSTDQSSDKDVAGSRGIFTLFQNSILNPFIGQANVRKKVKKKPNPASSLGDKIQNAPCNFSFEIPCDKINTVTSEKENTQISDLLLKQNSETSQENIKEYTSTKDIGTLAVKLFSQTEDEEKKSFIQNSSSIPSISQLETSHVNPCFSVSKNEWKSNACIKQDFVQENTELEDFEFVTGNNISSENNYIPIAPLQLDPMTSKDGLLRTENVANDNPGKSIHSPESVNLKNDLVISDDEIGEHEKEKNTKDMVLLTSFSKNPKLISESKKIQSNDLKLDNNSSNLSNAESKTNSFYNLSQAAFRLDNNSVELQNSSSPKIISYLDRKTNTSFDEDLPKEKSNIPDTEGTDMVHGHLNEELIELPVNNSSNLSNAETKTNCFYNLSQAEFRLDNNSVELQNSSSPKIRSYLDRKTNTSFDEDLPKEKSNIPDTEGADMVHGHLNEELIELPVETQHLGFTAKRKRTEDFEPDQFASNPIKKTFNALSSEESSLSNKIVNSVLRGPSVSVNGGKFPVTIQDTSGSVNKCIKPGILIPNNNTSESKVKLSSTIDNDNLSIKGPMKKKLKPVDSVTTCIAPVRVRGRTSQFRAFSKKISNEFDKNSKDNECSKSNEMQHALPNNFDQDKIIESYISTKKPKIRKEHQKIKNSNKTLLSHNTGTFLNLKEASSEYSSQFSQQDAKIPLKEPVASSEFSEQCKLYTTSKSSSMIHSSTKDKIKALNKRAKAEKGVKRIRNEENTEISFDNARLEKSMNLTSFVKEKDLGDNFLELCSSMKPPPELNNGESIVNGCKNMLSIDNTVKSLHTESECLTSKKRVLNSEKKPVIKKQNCCRNSESIIVNSLSGQNICSISENLTVNHNLLSKTMEEDWHFESDSDSVLHIDEGGNRKNLQSESLELCSSVDLPSDLNSKESTVNDSELDINNKIRCLPRKSEDSTSKKRLLNSDIKSEVKKQNLSRNSESTIANSSSNKNISTSNENFSAHDDLLSNAIKVDWHLENDSDPELVINEGDSNKPGSYNHSVKECFQETPKKLSNANSSCLSVLEEISYFDKSSVSINVKNIISSDNNETHFSKSLLLSESSLHSTQILPCSKSESFSLDEKHSESIVSNINVSPSVTNYIDQSNFPITTDTTTKIIATTNSQNINQTGTTKAAETSNPESKSTNAIIVPKFSNQEFVNNANEGFIKKGSCKFQHTKLVGSIIENKNCKRFQKEADLPFSLGIEEILDNIRGVHADSDSFKNYVNSLTKFLSYPQNAPDTAVLIFLVVHYLHRRNVNVLLKFLHNQEGYPFLLSSENCIVSALIEIEKLAKPHLQGLMNSLLSVLYNLILKKKTLKVYGMSSLCRVFTELCKRNGDKQKPIFLCCDLIKQKHPNSPFLLASIAGVWKELFEIPDNFSDEYITLLSSIAYGAQKRLPKISKSFQECSSKVIEEYIAVPSIPNPKQAIEFLREQIVLKSLQSSFENLWCLTSSLVILASWEPFEWAEQTLLNDYIVTNLKRFSRQDSNEQAFDLFCDLYVDILLLATNKTADKVLIKFVERKVATKEKEFVQDCAAAALLKYSLLANREVPASLTVFFQKNPEHPKSKLFEDILQRRKMSISPKKLSIKDVMIYT
ncbi:unnamed protein product [Larinioides sclopetarius]